MIIDPGAARGRGARSRDPGYLEQLRHVVDGEVEEKDLVASKDAPWEEQVSCKRLLTV